MWWRTRRGRERRNGSGSAPNFVQNGYRVHFHRQGGLVLRPGRQTAPAWPVRLATAAAAAALTGATLSMTAATAQASTARPTAGTSQPGTSQPRASQPGTSQPGTSQPGASQPAASWPGVNQPRFRWAVNASGRKVPLGPLTFA